MSLSQLPLNQTELAKLSIKSNWFATYAVLVNYGIIALAFLLAASMQNLFAYALSVCLLAGRSLGLAILTHDAAHSTLFVNRSVNQWIGKWLLGGLPNVPFEAYRKGHLEHHRNAGTSLDPDLAFVKGYPAKVGSITRKFLRDLCGVTGLRDIIFQVRTFHWKNQLPFMISHITLMTLLWIFDHIELYGLWWIGQVFVLPILMRLRVMGEHGGVPNHVNKDARLNTRTTLANWLERIFIAPNHVHWHLEHHLLPAVPSYNLRLAHKLLSARGYYTVHDCIATGYIDVVKRCISKNGFSGGNPMQTKSIGHFNNMH
jgi:fatty acid desaturase